ncbi:MAG: DUF1415 domain-containing protein [Chitinophagaceae bacterium]|nr:DUF1415 domain-containing protein [Chitinophagaceae bacterium]
MSTQHPSNQQVIDRTLNWIREVVIKCNFCPFANQEVQRNSIHYQVSLDEKQSDALQSFLRECKRLDDEPAIETTLLIFPQSFQRFPDYLKLVKAAEGLVKKNGYEGVYQIASFHPDYFFAGAPMDDAANFTNRSIYPMLHILREAGIEKVLERYPEPERIPEANMRFAREKGAAYMKMLRDSCF